MKSHNERLNDHVKSKRLKKSSQRDAVLSAIAGEKKHLTVEELYSLCKKTHPEIGIATVYRTIHLLQEAEIVRELRINDKMIRYELIEDTDHHDHLVCEKCGSFVEIASDLIEREQEKIAQSNGFTLTNHSLVLYGICKKCSEKKKVNI